MDNNCINKYKYTNIKKSLNIYVIRVIIANLSFDQYLSKLRFNNTILETEFWKHAFKKDEFHEYFLSKRDIQIQSSLHHSTGVWRLLYLEKKNIVVSGKDNGEITLWDLDTETIIKTYEEHINSIYDLKQISDNIFASAGGDNTIKIWNIDINASLTTIPCYDVYCLAYIPTFNCLVSGNIDNIALWNIEDIKKSKFTTFLIGHSNFIWCLLHPVKFKLKDVLLSGSNDHTIKLWQMTNDVKNDTINYKCIRTYEGHGSLVTNVTELSNDMFGSTCLDKLIRIWKVDNNNCYKVIDTHSEHVYFLLTLNDENIMSVGKDGIYILSIQTGSILKHYPQPTSRIIDLGKSKKYRFGSCYRYDYTDVFLWSYEKNK